MRQREEKIAGRLEQAERQRQEMEAMSQAYEEKARQIDQQREELLKEARHQAHEEQQRILKETRCEVDRKREQWEEVFRREQDDFLSDLRRQAGEMGLQAARRTLSQLADAELEERMCDAFALRLKQLGDQQREEILRHLGNGDADVFIRSAFEVPQHQRERLRETIRQLFESDAEISFEQSAELICGLELDVGGYSFGWNVKDFLRDLDLEFSERLTGKK